jgi:broad specificity phosphatase PhoE
MQIYLLRHAQTDANKQGILQGASMNTDINDTGKLQAKAFYDKYKNIPFDTIYTSHLKRTHQTVQLFSNTNIVSSKYLGELNAGKYEGQNLNKGFDNSYWKIVNEWLNGNTDARFEGGESFNEMHERIKQVYNEILQSKCTNVMICTHGRTMRTILHVFTGIPFGEVQQYKFNNTGLYVLQGELGKMDILKANDTTHLG